MKILLVIFTDPLSIFYAQENNNLFVQYYFKKDANVLKTAPKFVIFPINAFIIIIIRLHFGFNQSALSVPSFS